MKMKRSRSEVFGLRRVRLPHILFLIAALYLIVVCFKFPAYFETSSTPDNEAVKRYQLEVSKPSLRSAYKDEISEALENDNRFERVPQQEKNLEEKPGDNLRESPLEDGNRLEKVSQQEKEASFPPLDRRYGRLTGNILRQRHRTRDMSGLEKMADEAWTLGGKAWEEVLKYHEKDAKLASILEGKQERCPPWVSVTGAELTKGDRIMFLPCGLAAGSSITVVGTPHHAHSEYVPQLAKLKMGNPLVLVSQFKVELQGLKSVVAEDPPKILHLNPRLRGDWSHQPVIEHNTCYRMQWGAAQRCDGLPSKGDDDMLVDGFPRCEKWMRNDVVDSKESRTTTWFKRFVGRAQKPEVTWPFPFVEGKLFVLTIRAGVDGYHINVGGRHVTSFPYRTGFTLEDATGLSIKGDVEVHSVFATSLPTSHPSFSPQRVIEMSEKWKSKPLPHHPVLVFIGILSATNHFAERMAIRKTWMQSSAIKASNVVVRFFVALSPRREQNAVLKKEADYFGDIVILTFVDHYELVVLKTIAICEYAVQNVSASYVMKCDDDTFTRVDTILKELDGVPDQQSLYMGNLNLFHRPLRHGKWAVSFEEWPESVYPPYANGPGYIISSDIAKFVVSQRAKRKLRIFKMEDVSMGMWVEQFNSTTTVRYSHHGKFCQYGCMDNYYTAHYQSPRQMVCLWDNLARGRPRCCNFR
ncbi:hydroxyproline O-galactosyltransferase GALT2 [Cynara cardunculus var. scolymus]|uniref:hydroxyproline O-galactosyltransferase GALT2 n=1 Tax=Cynara cardunculus var. scolymus TaxID=59895 RepID=UPI000D631699|nr:hydroxyproline O-galactosyltransferase GALT2 [Cynara cardunculus var. scolymus]XP_024993156.1 hydroxyproline O-galactosyltransferase GALT2 [Cynara cardunculus var. scolymus]